MKKSYVVTNNDGIIFGVFSSEEDAGRCLKVGKKEWNESWTIHPFITDAVSNDAYRAGKPKRWLPPGAKGSI